MPTTAHDIAELAAHKAAVYIAYSEVFQTPEGTIIEGVEQTVEGFAKLIIALSRYLDGFAQHQEAAAHLSRAGISLLASTVNRTEQYELFPDEQESSLDGSVTE